METQTVPHTTMELVMFVYGELNHGLMKDESGRITLTIGKWPSVVSVYFENEKQFKAFVGEMIKAVANLK